uniref:Uncharacterized protein n=1 Tax=viral metagenome TaxID=1070528 RepID=A0A6C0BTI2_9ZZZZ
MSIFNIPFITLSKINKFDFNLKNKLTYIIYYGFNQ